MSEFSVAEDIMEFYNREKINSLLTDKGDKGRNALKLLVDMELVTFEGEKIVLTKKGRKFIDLPLP